MYKQYNIFAAMARAYNLKERCSAYTNTPIGFLVKLNPFYIGVLIFTFIQYACGMYILLDTLSLSHIIIAYNGNLWCSFIVCKISALVEIIAT